MSKPISFEEFASKKRQRPQEICFKCGELKDIYTHLDGDKDKPLCNACNMKLRRESPSAAQVKLLKLSGTAIGSMEAMLGLPVEEKQKRSLLDMQDELKLMVRVWLGDTQADEEGDDTTPREEVTDAPTISASDEFAEERKAAVSEQADNVFEVPQSASASRKNRKALIAAKLEAHRVARGEQDDALNPLTHAVRRSDGFKVYALCTGRKIRYDEIVENGTAGWPTCERCRAMLAKKRHERHEIERKERGQ